jgi:hydroxymethylpyrimidine/phosphomethylpyrimidine kinase
VLCVIVSQASQIVGHIMTETKLHINYCESFGISLAEITATEEKQGDLPSPF